VLTFGPALDALNYTLPDGSLCLGSARDMGPAWVDKFDPSTQLGTSTASNVR
jgi:hypothetical protein